MKVATKHFSSLFFFLAITFSYSVGSFAQQNKIDSLLTLLKADKPDTSKVNYLTSLSREYINISSYDSALHLANRALKIANLNLGKELPSVVKQNFKKGIAASFCNIGIVNDIQGNYPVALDYYLKGLKIDEELGNKNRIAADLGNIGIVYLEQSDYSHALDYYSRALKMDEEIGDKNGIAADLGNIGIVYSKQKNYSKALENYFKALEINKELGNKNGIQIYFGNIGGVYESQHNYILAIEYCQKALKMAEELGDKNNVGVYLCNIGLLYMSTKKYAEAEKNFLKSLSIAEANSSLDDIRLCNKNLSQLYEKMGKPAKALEHYKKSTEVKDSIFNMEKSKDITRKEMNYEFDKKEIARKAEQEKQDIMEESDRKRQQVFLWFLMAVAIAISAIALIVFRSWRITKQQNQVIESQKEKVEIQNKEITKQKQLVDAKNKDISDSVAYAKRIQSSFLTSEAYINRYLPEYFILYKPRDVVSGDFYWMHKQREYLYFCVADCTGHGIPGAFMSLIGMGILNEIVHSKQIKDTNKILDELRRLVILALNPEGALVEGKDGMDLILGRLDLRTKELQYSGAYNSFYVYRDGELMKHKPDKMPVGKYSEIEKPFTQYTIQLKTGDIIYASTDGFFDQFGGPQGKKYMSKRFEEYIASISQKSLEEQKERLKKEFLQWKGNMEQVDDICVFGVRI